MSVLPVGFGSALGGYQIERSLRFNSADSAYLNRTPASAGNRRTFTWSGWVKRGALSSSASYFLFAAGSFAGSTNTSIRILNDSINIYWGGTGGPQWTATAVLRDPSAWYHLVFAFDTTQATFGNRLKLYVNGVQSTVWSLQETGGLTAQNSDLYINNNQQHNLGASGTPGNYFDGYMTEINFIDGQALTPSSFGETDSATGVWKPKAYSGTYGTNGFYLNFSDNSGTTSTTLGKDSSGNGNNWTPNNFSVTAGSGNDSLVDSPTSYGTDTGVGGEVRGNYCTLNPLQSNGTLANGNLDYTTSVAGTQQVRGTFGMSSGKWYWEFRVNTGAACDAIGIISINNFTLSDSPGLYSNGYAYTASGLKGNNGNYVSYGASYTTGDIIGVALDMDAGTLVYYKNGISQGTAYSSISGTFVVCNGDSSGGSGSNMSANFGQRPFAYTAPSGFKALCTQNLPTPTIGATSTTQANDYFNVVTYTATENVASSITGVGFQPDFVWVKTRADVASHALTDAVRGVQKALFSNTTGAEVTSSTYLTSFDSDGFTQGGAGNFARNSLVAWNWKANGAGSSNTAGTITSTVSANTTSGFSIVTYTGTGANATVGHGLGVAPSMIIVKRTNSTNSWQVYHSNANASPASGGLFLNTTDAFTALSTTWNNTVPTSTVFSIGTAAGTNASGGTYVAYCFAPVAGYSAFGSYTGNGSTDGPFVYTGFRPRYILWKVSSGTTGHWEVVDTARETYNQSDQVLFASSSGAESAASSSYYMDILSNGFKIRNTDTSQNGNTYTYIYACFAETPAKFSLAR